MQGDGIFGDGGKSDTADGAALCTKVVAEQTLAQADAFKNLGTTIGADGRYAHLCHNLEQSFLYCLDIVGLCGGIVFLYLVALHQVVEDGKGHIGTEGRCSIAQQQGGVHGFAYLAALYYQCCLHALAHRNQVVVYGAHCQQ